VAADRPWDGGHSAVCDGSTVLDANCTQTSTVCSWSERMGVYDTTEKGNLRLATIDGNRSAINGNGHK